jgi:hypothetical protein
MQPHHGMADDLYFCFACLGGVDAEGVVAHWRALLVLGEETGDGRLVGGTVLMAFGSFILVFF